MLQIFNYTVHLTLGIADVQLDKVVTKILLIVNRGKYKVVLFGSNTVL